MNIKIDSAILLSLHEYYGKKAPQILWDSLHNLLGQFSPLELPTDEATLTNEDIGNHLAGRAKKRMDKLLEAKLLIKFFNDVSSKNFKDTDSNLSLVIALLESGYTEADIKAVIINKTEQWKGDDHLEHFLRPSTLFRKSNFDNYINEPKGRKLVEKSLASDLDALLEGSK